MDNPLQSPTILSICTGMRGLERGIERAIGEIRTEIILEIEAFVIENLVQQMEQGLLAPSLIFTDVKSFDPRPFAGRIDGITAGFPCPPFSVAGKRLGDKDPRHLWPYIGKGRNSIVGTIRPIFAFFENVPGLLTLGYREVKQDLESLGYKVEEGIFSAEEVGAPHQRKRLFILALDNTYLKRWKDEQKGFVKTDFDKERNLEVSSGQWNNEQCRTFESSSSILADGEKCTIRVEPTSEMEHSTKQRLQKPRFEWFRQYGTETKGGMDGRFELSGRELADSCFSNGWNVSRSSSTEQKFNEFGDNSSLADTDYCGSRKDSEQSKLRTDCIIEPSFYCWRTIAIKGTERQEGNRWPAQPGQEQFSWEEPRIKSRMGFSIDGYNFREDLLRMAGNAVVPQTAELAFITLMKKHGIEI